MQLQRNRIDGKIKNARKRLEDTKARLEEDFGRDSELYRELMENAYIQLKQRIVDYLDGTTDTYPLPNYGNRELKYWIIGAVLFTLFHGTLYIGEKNRLKTIENKYGKQTAYIAADISGKDFEERNMLERVALYTFFYGKKFADDAYVKNIENRKELMNVIK